MANFEVVNLGTFAEISKRKENDVLPEGKVFLKDKLELTSCEISVNSLAKGTKSPYDHKHRQNEEIYIFLQGEGIMSVDGEEFPVREGTCARVAPAGCRGLENTGDGDIRYICIQAKENSLQQSLFEDGEICSQKDK